MIKLLSNSITKYLEKNNHSLTRTDLLKISYSLEVILGDLLKFIILFLIFLYMKQTSIFLLSFFILISTRPLIGGIHCKTFNSCLLCTFAYFLTILAFIEISPKINIIFSSIFILVCFILTLIYAPCYNANRPIKNRPRLKILSLLSLSFWSILYFKIPDIQICNCIFISILLQIAQVIIMNMKGVKLNGKIS